MSDLWIIIPLGIVMLLWGLIQTFGIKAELGPQIQGIAALILGIVCIARTFMHVYSRRTVVVAR